MHRWHREHLPPVSRAPPILVLIPSWHMAHGHRSRSSPPRVLISGHRGPGLGAGTMAGDSGGRSPGGPRFRGRYLTILNTHRGSVRSDHTAPGLGVFCVTHRKDLRSVAK